MALQMQHIPCSFAHYCFEQFSVVIIMQMALEMHEKWKIQKKELIWKKINNNRADNLVKK